MPKKIIHAQLGGDRLRVENTWLFGAKLFLNDQLIASNRDLFALDKSRPLMSAEACVNGIESRIDVIMWAIFTVKIQIRVNGDMLAGEEF